MLLGAVSGLGRGIEAAVRLDRYLQRFEFDVAVLIDSPALNLRLAARIKARGIPVLYYVAPQLWAWGAYRIHRVKRCVDQIAALLPFEETYFRERGVEATFVGHPLFDRLRNEPIDPAQVVALRRGGQPIIAIFPGSRRHEIVETFVGQLEVARAIADRHPAGRFLVSVANEQVQGPVETLLRASGVSATTHAGQNGLLLSAADLALVTSGTMTLEVAVRGTPMIVMYNGSKWGYHVIGRWLIGTRYLSLVNILAGRELVPEFMPYYTSTAPIAEAAIALLSSDVRRAAMSRELKSLMAPLSQSEASDRVAALLLDMTGLCHAP